MEIIVPGQYTERDKQVAAVKRSEFRRNPYTSGSAHLDNMIALNKALILCDTHKRKFNAKAARYRVHPAANLKRVRGNCDVCKQFCLATLFLNEKDWLEEQRKLDKWRTGLEYAHFVKH
jgi:hypothetical protein